VSWGTKDGRHRQEPGPPDAVQWFPQTLGAAEKRAAGSVNREATENFVGGGTAFIGPKVLLR
jgi:hypothetical protein